MPSQVKEKTTERVNQKKRTRAELLRTARQLIEAGSHPSVAEVADAAGISRATAYRYFSKPEEMVREAVLDAVAEKVRLPEELAMSGSVEERLDAMVSQIVRMVIENEAVFRTFLAASITSDSQIRRGGRRLSWIAEALEPARAKMSKESFTRLTNSLALLTGVEALVVLRDICEVDPAEAEQTIRWSAQAMLTKALAETQ